MPDSSAHWIGCLGADARAAIERVAAGRMTTTSGAGWAIASAYRRGASSTTETAGRLPFTVSCGVPDTAGCSAAIGPNESVELRCDPFGLYPVYVTTAAGTRWFASDLRLLRAVLPRRTDFRGLHGYLCFSHVPVPLSIQEGVAVVPAGETWTLTRDSTVRAPFAGWQADREPLADMEKAQRELLALLRAAVARRLNPDRAAAVYLSGGLDSSLVAALLREAGAALHLFTLDFGAPFDVEVPYARRVAEHLGLPLTLVPARPRDIAAVIDATADALHQPFGDAVTAPLYLLGRAASRVAGVVFNGEGGDQLFGGWANKPMVASLLYGGAALPDAYLATYHRFYGLTDRLYAPGSRSCGRSIDAAAWIREALAPHEAGLLHTLRAANLRLKGAQNIAPRCIQVAAAHGLDVRAPFFDRSLAAWTFAVPPDWLLDGSCEKLLLKRVAEPLLPPEVVWREKRGMGVPVTEWCLGPLRREIGRRLSARRLRRDGWFDPAYVDMLRRGVDTAGEFRRRRVGEKLWTLLMLHAGSDQWTSSGHD